MDAVWRLRMLGAFTLERDGAAVTTFNYRRPDALLAYVALRPEQPQARPVIAAALWPGKPRRHALNRITEVQIHLNRHFAGVGVDVGVLSNRRQTIQLSPVVRTDVQEFEDLVAAALREPDEQRRARVFEQALEWYLGPLLPPLDEPWVIEERQRLQGVRDFAAQQLVQLAGGVPPSRRTVGGAGLTPAELARYLARGAQYGGAPSDVEHPLGMIRGVVNIAEPEIAEDVGAAVAPTRPGGDRDLAEECVALVERAEPHLRGPDRRAWFDRLDVRRDDLHHAIEWAIDRERTEFALRLTGALWRYWYSRERITEGRRYLDQALTLAPRPEGRWYAKAAHGAGSLALHDGDLRVARRRFEAALTIWRELEDVGAIGRVLDDLGLIAYKEGDFERAGQRFDESLAVLAQLPDPAARLTVLRNAAVNAQTMGDEERAEAHQRERLSIGRKLEDPDVVAWSLVGLVGSIRTREGVDAARAAQAEARSLFERLDDARGLATCLRAYGYDRQLAGNLDAARAYYDSSLCLCVARRDVWGIGESKRYLASVAEAAGDHAQAAEGYREAAILLSDLGEQRDAAKARKAIADLGGD
jgi:tetratricopeptide (TPR) repeat protein